MQVGIVADSHDHMERIGQAVQILRERGIKDLIHAGDFVAPFALIPIVDAGFRLHAVFGNNDGEIQGLSAMAEPVGGIHKGPYRFELGGKRFLVAHAPLSDKQIAKEGGKTDYIVTGHTHVAGFERVGDLVVVNPGELCGWLKGRSTFGILEMESGEWELIEL